VHRGLPRSHPRGVHLPALLLALIFAGAGAGPGPPREARAAEDHPERIVLLSIDGLGEERAGPDRMPVLAGLLARGARCERARTQATLTIPSTAALLSVRIPAEGGSAPERDGRTSAKGPTLAAALADRGYAGLALPADPLAHAETGLGEGFARFAVESPSLADSARVHTALAWLAMPAKRFAWVALSFGEAQAAWRREDGPAFPDPAARVARAREIDAAIARLVTGLERGDRADRTLLAVAGTHGLPADSDPRRVPVAFVRLDGSSGRTVRGEASLADVAPTLVRAAGGGTRGFEGSPLLAGRRPARRAKTVEALERPSPCRSELPALVGDRSVAPDSMTLVHLRSLVERCPDDRRIAIEEADAFSRAGQDTEAARLFLDVRGRWPADPTSAIGYAQHLIRHKRFDLVAGALAPIPPSSPYAAEAGWLEVAALAGELRFAEAVRAAERAAARSVPGPIHAQAVAALVRIREAQRDTELHPSDPAVHLEFGRRLADYGLMDEGYMQMHKARFADSTTAEPDFWIGAYLISEGRLKPAAATFERGLKKNPSHIRMRRVLAETLIRLDRGAEAIPHLERIVAEDPKDAVSRYNLACMLAKDGRADAALEALRNALDAGYSDWDQLTGDPDLASLRDRAEFRALLARRPGGP